MGGERARSDRPRQLAQIRVRVASPRCGPSPASPAEPVGHGGRWAHRRRPATSSLDQPRLVGCWACRRWCRPSSVPCHATGLLAAAAGGRAHCDGAPTGDPEDRPSAVSACPLLSPLGPSVTVLIAASGVASGVADYRPIDSRRGMGWCSVCVSQVINSSGATRLCPQSAGSPVHQTAAFGSASCATGSMARGGA